MIKKINAKYFVLAVYQIEHPRSIPDDEVYSYLTINKNTIRETISRLIRENILEIDNKPNVRKRHVKIKNFNINLSHKINRSSKYS